MSGRSTLADVVGAHMMELAAKDGLVVSRPSSVEQLAVKTANPLTAAVVRANLANHLLTSHVAVGNSAAPPLMSRPAIVHSTVQTPHGATAIIVASSAPGSSASQLTLNNMAAAVAHTVRPVTAADINRPAVAPGAGMVCIMPMSMAGLRAAPIPIQRLPSAPGDGTTRLPLHTIPVSPRVSTAVVAVDRSRFTGQPMAALRSAVVVHTSITGSASTTDTNLGPARVLLPGTVPRQPATIIRTSVGGASGLSNLPVAAATSSATTIPVAILRPPSIISQSHHILSYPQRTIYTSDPMHKTADVRAISKPRGPLLMSTSATGLQAAYGQHIVTASAPGAGSVVGSGAGQMQALNLVTKPKVLLPPSAHQAKQPTTVASQSITPVPIGSSGSQQIALNVIQATGRTRPMHCVIPTLTGVGQSAANSFTAAKPVGIVGGTPMSIMAPSHQLSTVSVVTVARPLPFAQQHPQQTSAPTSAAGGAAPRHKSNMTAVLTQQQPVAATIQLQGPPGHTGGGAVLLGGSLLAPPGTVLSMEQFGVAAGNRMHQNLDRNVPVGLQHRETTAHILTLPPPRHGTFDPPSQSAPFALLGPASRPAPGQHHVTAVSVGSATTIAATIAGGTRLGQVVVTMDGTRHTMLSLHPQYVIDGSNASTAALLSAQVAAAGGGLPHHPAAVQQPHHGAAAATDGAAAASQTVMSPRPSILRKRPHDSTPKKTNLLNVINASTDSMAGVNSTVLSSPAAAAPVVPYSPFKPLDASRDNSQSSTDTASCSGSTQGSCPPSVEKIKVEMMDANENGIITNGHVDIPRKKPRKQSLHANEEMPAPGFLSSGEDEDERVAAEAERRAAAASARIKLQKQLEKAAEEAFRKDAPEYCDEDGVRFSVEDGRRRFPGGLVGTFQCTWKSRSNHFISYNDVVAKEERRSTVNELANTRRVSQRANCWTLFHLADQFDQLRELETDVLDRLKETVPHEALERGGASSRHVAATTTTNSSTSDASLHTITELVLGNMQRCQQFVDRLDEARTSLLSMTTTHRPRIFDIVGRHQAKRTVKKKERV